MRDVTISLDWRFDALRIVSKAHLQGLQDFHAHVKRYSEEAIEAWEQACEGVTDDNSPGAHELSEQRNQIEDLLDAGQTLGILGLYAFLENYLNLVIEHLREGGAPITESGGRAFNLNDLRREFRKAGIDLGKPPFSWDSLNQMRLVRNCIAHADGWISEAFAKRLAKVGMRVKGNTPLSLPATDFERRWRLVNETCSLIHSECSKWVV